MEETASPIPLNLLVIAHYFPPMGLSGVQRTLKFVKYLPSFGWRPIVLTAAESPFYAQDPSLVEEIRPLIEANQIRIVRTKSNGLPLAAQRKPFKVPKTGGLRLRNKLVQTFYQPDSRIRWRKPAIKLAEQVLGEEHVDAIFTTAPPFTDFLIARELSRTHHLPYLMDYRDAWVGNSSLNFYATPFHKAYARKLEYQCLRGASGITVVNRWMKEVILQQHDFLSHNDITILPHGFDTDDLRAAMPIAQTERNPQVFRLTYSGILGAYYVGTAPHQFFRAIALACEKQPSLRKDLELCFVGLFQEEYRRAVADAGITQNVRVLEYRPHVEAVATLLASDALWLVMAKDVSAPGKLYEYFGTRKPILGIVPQKGQAARLLRDYGAALLAPPTDSQAIADQVLTLYQHWKAGSTFAPPNEQFVQQFDRKALTGQLARELTLLLKP